MSVDFTCFSSMSIVCLMTTIPFRPRGGGGGGGVGVGGKEAWASIGPGTDYLPPAEVVFTLHEGKTQPVVSGKSKCMGKIK